jgi:hypothetical protein
LAEANLPYAERVHGRYQMLQVSTEPVQLPQDQRVPRLKRAQTGRQPRPVVAPARSQILINAPGLDTDRRESIALEVEHLAAIGLGDTGIPDQHASHRAGRCCIGCKRTVISATGFLTVLQVKKWLGTYRQKNARFPENSVSYNVGRTR